MPAPLPVSTARAPARIDLAGGTLDIYPICQLEPEAVTVNLAIDRLATARVRVRDDGRFVLAARDRRLRVVCRERAELRAAGPLALHRQVALHLGPAGGVEIETRSGVPAGSGLGGSSTLVVAMLHALAGAGGPRLGRAALLRTAGELEARVIGVPTGSQDHVGALYGGLSVVTFPPGGPQRRALPLDVDALAARLVLVYTGVPHDSATNNWEITKRYVDGDRRVRARIAAVADAARALLAALRAGDLDAAGRAMAAEWEARKRLAPGVTTPGIEALADAVGEAGALATKACGAGGGGCVVVWCRDGTRRAVAAAARAAGGRVLPFRAERRGVR